MAHLWIIALLAAVSAQLGDSAVSVTSEKSLDIIHAKLRVIYNLLDTKCPSLAKFKRQIADKHQSLNLEVQERLYANLVKKLHECSDNSDHADNTSKPIECRSAQNLTEPWRLDYTGSDIRPGGPYSEDGFACDLNVNQSQWFRFSGAAGNKMLDTCPEWRSCGTKFPFWTDEPMPQQVGVKSTVQVYGVVATFCELYKEKVEVMRCSWDTNHDFVYRQTIYVPGSCAKAFCGMT